jgi:hypothetical protein
MTSPARRPARRRSPRRGSSAGLAAAGRAHELSTRLARVQEVGREGDARGRYRCDPATERSLIHRASAASSASACTSCAGRPKRRTSNDGVPWTPAACAARAACASERVVEPLQAARSRRRGSRPTAAAALRARRSPSPGRCSRNPAAGRARRAGPSACSAATTPRSASSESAPRNAIPRKTSRTRPVRTYFETNPGSVRRAHSPQYGHCRWPYSTTVIGARGLPSAAPCWGMPPKSEVRGGREGVRRPTAPTWLATIRAAASAAALPRTKTNRRRVLMGHRPLDVPDRQQTDLAEIDRGERMADERVWPLVLGCSSVLGMAVSWIDFRPQRRSAGSAAIGGDADSAAAFHGWGQLVMRSATAGLIRVADIAGAIVATSDATTVPASNTVN